VEVNSCLKGIVTDEAIPEDTRAFPPGEVRGGQGSGGLTMNLTLQRPKGYMSWQEHTEKKALGKDHKPVICIEDPIEGARA